MRDRLSRLKSLRLLRGASISGELSRLERQLEKTSEPTDKEIWQHVELARHDERPYTLDYVERIFEDFIELHGDRLFGDDEAMAAHVFEAAKTCDHTYSDAEVLALCAEYRASRTAPAAGAAA